MRSGRLPPPETKKAPPLPAEALDFYSDEDLGWNGVVWIPPDE